MEYNIIAEALDKGFEYFSKGIEWVEGTGIISKIPDLVSKVLSFIAENVPNIVDWILG